MSMSDDVSGAVVGISSNVAQKGVEVTTHVTDKVIDAIAKLIQAASNKNLGRGSSKTAPEVTSSDMTDIDAGHRQNPLMWVRKQQHHERLDG